MYGDFFGQFLIKKGAASPQQVDEALASQQFANKPIGALAIELGYLSAAQVEDVLSEQRMRNDHFGAIAREMTMLGEHQLEILLSTQAEKHLHLGEALIRNKVLDYAGLQTLLEEFHVQNQELGRDIHERIMAHPDATLLQEAAGTVQRMFSRAIAGAVKVVSASASDLDLADYNMAVSIPKKTETGSFRYGFAFKRWYLYALVYCLLQKQTTHDQIVRQTLLDFSRVIDYALCTQFKKSENNCEPGEPEIIVGPPKCGPKAMTLTMFSSIGHFAMFFDPDMD